MRTGAAQTASDGKSRRTCIICIIMPKCVATSPLLVTKPHLWHAIVVRLHVHKADDVILTPEMAGKVGV